MKVRERIEELRPLCVENTDFMWCKKQMKKYKYAEQKLYDYIADNVETILELTLEEKDKLYSEILDKAIKEFEI